MKKVIRFFCFYVITLSINYYNNYFLIYLRSAGCFAQPSMLSELEDNIALVLRAFKLKRIRNNVCTDEIYSFLLLVAVNNYLS